LNASSTDEESATDLSIDWPPFLRPVVAKPKALAAMFGWMEAISEWAEKDEVPFSFSNQPDFVKKAAQNF
jgi:hypothetical protein